MNTSANIPWAHQLRPQSWQQFYGQQEIFQKYPHLLKGNFSSLVLTGPSGCGKTTLAQLLAQVSEREFYSFNAVLGGVADLKKLIQRAIEAQSTPLLGQKQSLIFIDEIHRFNKAQQDALLPYVERGDFVLVGATTENPRVSLNPALLSRLKIIRLQALSENDLFNILKSCVEKQEVSFELLSLSEIAQLSNGDARIAINTLQAFVELGELAPPQPQIAQLMGEQVRRYDKNSERHYDVISAFIKSMRGSDPQSALLWLAVMLEGGEDPVFIARRLVIFASEDVGNADPSALALAMNALQAVEKIGMPEARITLAQATSYLAATHKSNASYQAINLAMEYVQSQPSLEVPTHLRNHHPDKKKYQYPHNFSQGFVKQDYGANGHQFYQPTERGREGQLKQRLESLQ